MGTAAAWRRFALPAGPGSHRELMGLDGADATSARCRTRNRSGCIATLRMRGFLLIWRTEEMTRHMPGEGQTGRPPVLSMGAPVLRLECPEAPARDRPCADADWRTERRPR